MLLYRRLGGEGGLYMGMGWRLAIGKGVHSRRRNRTGSGPDIIIIGSTIGPHTPYIADCLECVLGGFFLVRSRRTHERCYGMIIR